MSITHLGKQRAIHIAIIIAAVTLAYHNVLQAGFVSDDYAQILDNPHIRSYSNIPGLFSRGVWQAEDFPGGLYRPLAFLSWLIEYSIVGARPFLYHLDNVVLHLLCSILVYTLVRSMLSDGRAAFFAALIFSVHPVHTEAVDWIACRMELMYAAFALGSLILFITKPRTVRYVVLSNALYMCALLSKESAVVLPVLVVAYQMIFEADKGMPRKTAISVVPYAITTAAYLALRISVIGLPAGTTTIYSNYLGYGAYDMFLLMSRAFYEYIRLTLLPFDLRTEYIFRPPGSMADPRVLIPWIALGVLAYYTLRSREKSGVAVFSGIWFFAALLPVSNIIPAGIIVAERALYVPSMAACLILGSVLGRLDRRHMKMGRAMSFAAAGVLACLVASFTLLTLERNAFWAGLTKRHLIDTMLARTKIFPENPVNHRLLARAYVGNGDTGPRAEKELRESIRLDPYDPESYFLFTELYMKRKDYENALAALSEAIRLDELEREEYYYLSGIALQKLGRYEEAHGMLSKVLGMSPGNAVYQVSMGNLLLESGKEDKAMERFMKAAQLDPKGHDAYLGMAIVQDTKGEPGKAVANLRKALSLKPEDPDLLYFLALSLVRSGDPHAAVAELNKAIALRPGFEDAARLLETLEAAGTGGASKR